MMEIHGKSTLVRVSARFELVRVRVSGSQLQMYEGKQGEIDFGSCQGDA